METQSVKKFSFLGLVLLGASAVTAAIVPSKKTTDNNFRAIGHLQLSTNAVSDQTCVPGLGDANCNYTATDVDQDGTGSSSTNYGAGVNSRTGNTGTDTTRSNDPIE